LKRILKYGANFLPSQIKVSFYTRRLNFFHMSIRTIALLGALLLLSCSIAEAQKFRQFKNRYNQRMYRHGQVSFTGGAALATYFGDLKDNPVDLWAKPSTQLGVQYRYNNHLHFRTEVLWYRISGADSQNDRETDIYTRNLSFRADNFEWNVQAMWQLFNKYARYNRPTLNPYAFIGVGLTTNNPKANLNGEWYNLRPLQTEGNVYSSVVFVLPAGLGLTYHLNSNWDISAEYGYRITFNDYLDDVSTTHLGVDNISDPVRRALSDRRPEIGLEPVPAGNQRGNPASKDWYLIAGLKVTYSPGISNQKRYKRAKFRGR
jgi:opacity protein-like surface antigen